MDRRENYYGKLIDKKVVTCNWAEWAAWQPFNNDVLKRRVGQTFLPGDIMVSTVFLDMNHDWMSLRSGEGIWFETMVFGGGEWEGYCRRYATYEEAEAGHAETLAQMAEYPKGPPE